MTNGRGKKTQKHGMPY